MNNSSILPHNETLSSKKNKESTIESKFSGDRTKSYERFRLNAT